MSDALRDKVRDRIGKWVRGMVSGIGDSDRAYEAIMADVETALVLAKREARAHAWVDAERAYSVAPERRIHSISNDAASTYPLPTRTRQVLREESVPGAGGALYRWNPGRSGGRLETRMAHLRSDAPWESRCIHPHESGLMRHALDLYENPYRTEQVPADESDPWGDAPEPGQ